MALTVSNGLTALTVAVLLIGAVGSLFRDGRPRLLTAGACIALLALLLRLYHLTVPSLWLDELGTHWVVRTDQFAEFAQRVFTCVPTTMAYYAVVYAVTHLFGYSEATLRAPSVVAGLLAIPAMVGLIRLVSPDRPRAALLGALLLSATFYHMVYSDDARPYALAYLIAIGATAAFVQLLRAGTPSAGAAYAILSAAAIYVHWLSGIYVTAQALVMGYVLLRRRPPLVEWLRRMVFFALAGALLLPVLPKLRHDLELLSHLDWTRTQQPADLVRTAVEALCDPVPLGALLFGLLGTRIARRHHAIELSPEEREARHVLACLYVMPILLVLVLYVGVGTFFFVPRHMYYLSIPSLGLSSLLIERLPTPRYQRTVALMVLVPSLGALQLRSLFLYDTFKGYNVEDRWRDALARLEQVYRPSDLLLLRSGFIEEDFVAEVPDSPSRAFMHGPLAGLYNTTDFDPVLHLTKTWDSSRFERHFQDLDRSALATWAAGGRVILFGVDARLTGTSYFERTVERFRHLPGAPPLTTVVQEKVGRLRLWVLQPAAGHP